MTLPALPLYSTANPGSSLSVRHLLLLTLCNLVDDCSFTDLLNLDVSDDTLASMVAYAAYRNSKYERALACFDAKMEGYQQGFDKAREIYKF